MRLWDEVNTMEKTYKVQGMHCKSCEMLLTDSLEEAGIKVKSISHVSGVLKVEWKGDKEAECKAIIQKEGYKVV